MKATVKDADKEKKFSPTRSDNSIQRLRDEPERQLGSLRGVIGDIRRNGGTPSVEGIATQLGGMGSAQRIQLLSALQQTHGNRYVQRVIAGIQAKLKVSEPGDIYEQEADRVADAVMRMPEPQVQQQTEPEEVFQAKELTSQTSESTLNIESRINALQARGRPLPESTRSFFEPRFGHDFSQVRVHTDAQAAEMARAMNARAFTTGRDIVFGAGQYAPEATGGKKLLAHELTHVVQQKGESKLTRVPIYASVFRLQRTPDENPADPMGTLHVALFLVECDQEVDDFYSACGEPFTAGPFCSAGSAIDWRDEFCPDGEISSYWNTDEDACNDYCLIKRRGAWERG